MAAGAAGNTFDIAGFGGAVPGFASGGIADGLAMVGERGRELVNFGEPSRVFSNAETERILSGGGRR